MHSEVGAKLLQGEEKLPSGMKNNNSYRPEIDGLRAVAVILVVLFHAGFEWIPGGYIGVDIFFVISGYLITRLMLAQIFAGKFSFAQFYGRRVRRLAPALLATIFLTLIGAAVFFSINDLVRFVREVLVSLVGVSNFYYTGQGDYFSQASLHFPLLHTWSLAVEEQYYLVAPLSTWLLYKYFKLSGVLIISILLLLLSLGAAEFVLNSHAKIAFYWPFFRAWEFLIGALVLFVPRGEKNTQVVSIIALTIGLAMILGAAFSFDANSGIPGWPALLPCLGAAIILYGVQDIRSSWFLNNPGSVGIGLISYSLYLVHWPVMVMFAYARLSLEILPQDRIPAILISIIIAIGMYFIIERRFRAKGDMAGYLSGGAFAKNCGFAAISLALVVSSILWTSGWSWRLKTPYTPSAEGYGVCKRTQECKFDRSGAVSVILAGDSHAKHLATGLGYWATQESKSAVLLTSPSCGVPSKLKTAPHHGPQCLKIKKLLADNLTAHPNATVVIAQRWRGYGEKEQVASALEAFLSKHRSQKIVVIGQFPQPELPQYLCGNIPSYVFANEKCETKYRDDGAAQYNVLLKAVVGKFTNAEFANPAMALCENGLCKGVIGHNPVFSDEHHVTDFAGKYLFKNLFSPFLE